jgi:hypothetical protein
MNPKRIKILKSQWLNTVDEGRQLELFAADEAGFPLDGIQYPLLTIVAEPDTEVLFVAFYTEKGFVQAPASIIQKALIDAVEGVHSESWYESASVWVFNGINSRFSGGVFTCIEMAETWIKNNKLTGVLTRYPLNQGIYDWAIENSSFTPTKDKHASPDFIGGFTSASQIHFHYESGERE